MAVFLVTTSTFRKKIDATSPMCMPGAEHTHESTEPTDEEVFNQLHEWLQRVLADFERAGGVTVDIGVGSTFCIAQSAEEAEELLLKSIREAHPPTEGWQQHWVHVQELSASVLDRLLAHARNDTEVTS